MTTCWRNTMGKCWRIALDRGEHTWIRPGSLPFSYNEDSQLVAGETGKKNQKPKRKNNWQQIRSLPSRSFKSTPGRTGAHRQLLRDGAQAHLTLEEKRSCPSAPTAHTRGNASGLHGSQLQILTLPILVCLTCSICFKKPHIFVSLLLQHPARDNDKCLLSGCLRQVPNWLFFFPGQMWSLP